MDDMNSFIHLAKQMGMIENDYFKFLPNSTNCKTISDAYQSLEEANSNVVVEVNDIYGMLVLLGFGLGLASVTFIAEVVYLVRMFYLYSPLHFLCQGNLYLQIFLQNMKKGLTKLAMINRRFKYQRRVRAWH